MGRSIKTLLLCKMNPYQVRYGRKSYQDLYRNLYAGESAAAGRKYITYGNFDAISIYDTGSGDRPDWLQEVESDRKRISEQISEDVCYHPIHMVSYQQDADFWKKSETYSACLITLVYGVMPGEGSSEDYVRKALEAYTKPDAEDKKHFAVYQAINICDAVVIWMTNDINYALKQTSKLMRRQKARKTYSLLGLTMDAMEDPDTYLEMLNSTLTGGPFSVRLQGSIRDQYEAQELFFSNGGTLFAGLDDRASIRPNRVFGNEDFAVSLFGISKTQFLRFVVNMTKNSEQISKACWEIHTEFMVQDECGDQKPELKELKHPLDRCFRDYKAYYQKLKEDPVSYPWAPSYLELLSTHVNIDHNPILHAPASLFAAFARIANHYFEKATDDKDAKQAEAYRQILVKSMDGIQGVIRNWSHLTDQLIRTDDVVFHGLGSIPVLYETLPEPILEFYHAFLMKIVEIILDVDRLRKDPSKAYEYDFLLVPEQNQRPRISKMFALTDYHTEKLEKAMCGSCEQTCPENCARWYLWPEKQVYLVEFQSSLLYDPISFLFQMVHECFHYFGDSCRMRDERAACLTEILTTEIQFWLNLERPWYHEFRETVKEKLKVEEKVALNLRRTGDQLFEKLNDFADNETIRGLQSDSRFYYLSGSEFYAKWRSFAASVREETENKWVAIIGKWMYYFSECYADLMALLLLQTGAERYLEMICREWENAGNDIQDTDSVKSWEFVQRIAIVLGTFFLQDREYSSAELEQATVIRLLKDWNRQDFVGNNRENILATLRSLFDWEAAIYKTKYNDPPAKIRPVVDYLFTVKEAFAENFERKNAAKLKELRDQFRAFFMEEALFTEQYHQFMRQARTEGE